MDRCFYFTSKKLERIRSNVLNPTKFDLGKSEQKMQTKWNLVEGSFFVVSYLNSGTTQYCEPYMEDQNCHNNK